MQNYQMILVATLAWVLIPVAAHSQEKAVSDGQEFTEQDRLRGSITPQRQWWDLKKYELAFEVFPESKSLKGCNAIFFEVLQPSRRMQIDLQQPLEITKVLHDGSPLKFERDDNVYWIDFDDPLPAGTRHKIQIHYEGTPVESKNPPWSGGFSWQQDQQGQHFIATSCQGIGASIWWPNKDHGYDEPDEGMEIRVTVPKDLVAVSNGRLQETISNGDKKTFCWVVTNPINNYGVNVNIGDYVNFSEVYAGEFGELDLDYWVLDHQRDKAETQFKEAPRTIEAFEYWFGKYPFYEDSYKLVVVPYLGMEHQSSVTYGNGFRNGYRGTDLSGTGVGMKFDFIIVHESGHEWFGNNISMRDAADMWIHESFTNYSENLFVEYHFTKQEAEDYVIGCRKRVRNDRPIIAVYDVNQSGSGDMYYKGGNMLHTMRHIIDNDETWRSILRGLNKKFWHQTVTTEQVESYINEQSGFDFTKYFDQYLRTTKIPVLKYKIDGKQVEYYFDNVVEGFSIPIRVSINGAVTKLTPTEQPQIHSSIEAIETFEVDRNFYVDVKND